MSKKYRSYNNFNSGAILDSNGSPAEGWKENAAGGTPISSDNLNAMLQMLIDIRNVIGKTDDFAININGSTPISQPDTTIAEGSKSVATYIKEVADAVIGTGSEDPGSTIKKNEVVIQSHISEYEGKVSELEAADKATAEELAAHEAKYETDLAALIDADAANTSVIESLTADYNTKVDELEAADENLKLEIIDTSNGAKKYTEDEISNLKNLILNNLTEINCGSSTELIDNGGDN